MQSNLFFMPLKIRDGEDGMLLNPLALSNLAASTLFLGCSLYGAGFREGVYLAFTTIAVSSFFLFFFLFFICIAFFFLFVLDYLILSQLICIIRLWRVIKIELFDISCSICAFQQHMKPFFNISFPTLLSSALFILYFRFMKQFLSQVAFNISSSLVFVYQQRNAIVVLHCTVAVQNL
ncbi:uncharacterized protein LOC116028438 [Ipomoea triloba]|uniref:uncharacterized protein LOC116028438 n=1 Tax=Ipomoea triloba TaxID=35885 RepID=UPI00125DE48B|nr:uncharacterized protein LOC116028438 [Ipomoea triloba]